MQIQAWGSAASTVMVSRFLGSSMILVLMVLRGKDHPTTSEGWPFGGSNTHFYSLPAIGGTPPHSACLSKLFFRDTQPVTCSTIEWLTPLLFGGSLEAALT